MTHNAKARRLLAVVGMTAVIPLAAACGSGSTPPATTGASASSSASSAATSATSEGSTEAAGDYCDVLKSGQQELEGLSGTLSDSAALEKGLAVVRKIEASAPPEVKAAWGDFIAFVESATSGNTSAMTDAMTKMEAAGAKIEAHAKTSCNLDLS